MSPFVKGLVLGFYIAAPIGPIGLLCIRRSVTEGRLVGFVSGLGAAVADVVYGAIAALGFGAVMHALIEHRHWFQLGGGIFLVYLGAVILRSPGPNYALTLEGEAAAPGRPPRRLWAAFGSTLALTLANPMTIVSFIGFLAALGASAPTPGLASAGLFMAGVFLGSTAWWLAVSLAGGWIGERLQHGGMRRLNIGSGLLIAAFGLWQLVEFMRS